MDVTNGNINTSLLVVRKVQITEQKLERELSSALSERESMASILTHALIPCSLRVIFGKESVSSMLLFKHT